MRIHAPQPESRTAVRAALVAVAIALFALAAVCAGCGDDGTPQQAEVHAALERASAALVAKDAVAWFRALPAEGKATEDASYQVYARLAHFPWAAVDAEADPVKGASGRYHVRIYGRLAGSDTSALICERVLDFARQGGRLAVVADRTEEQWRGAYYLAYTDPVVVVRPHLVIVGERWQKRLISLIAACDGQAERVVKRLQLDPKTAEIRRKTLLHVCASPEQASMASVTVDSDAAAFVVEQQVYAVSWRLRYWKKYARAVVRHELAHVYAPRFGDGERFVGLLVEGLAVAAEGGIDFGPLRAEVARGNRVLPLKRGLMHGSLWRGLSDKQIDLAYLEGGALVLYLEKRWGLKRAWAFADAVVAEERTPAGIERATRRSLGVTWRELYGGWKRFVKSL